MSRKMSQGGFLLTIADITNLQKLEVMKQDFVANVSHEFKTPLTTIRGYAETLISKAETQEVKESILYILKQTKI